MQSGNEYKKLIKIAIPVTISQLGHITVGVADSIMLGQLGGLELAASTIGFSLFFPFMMLGIGLSYGLSPLIAKANGENNTQKIKSILYHGLWLNLSFGILISLFLWFSSSFFDLLHIPEDIQPLTVNYFTWMAFSMVPLMFFQVNKQFAEGFGITKFAMTISITGNLLNIFLNYLFIYGKHGFPPMGVEGAAIATFISRIYMALVVGIYILFNTKLKSYYKQISTSTFNWKEFVFLSKISFPIGLQLIMESGAFGFTAIMSGWLGTNEIAAHQIALNLAGITYMAATGLSASATVRVGNELGRQNYLSMQKAGTSAFIMVALFMSINAFVFIALRFYLPTLYLKDVEIIKLSSSLLLITAFFQLSDGIQCVGLGNLRGLGDVKIPSFITLLAYWILGIPIGYILAFKMHLGVEGIWYGLLIGLSVAAVLLLVRFYYKSRAIALKPSISTI
jgi:MATE family multidrug resistance protein